MAIGINFIDLLSRLNINFGKAVVFSKSTSNKNKIH